MKPASASSITSVWPEVLAEIREEVGEQRFNLWLGHTELVRFDEERVEVGVPNLFIQEWLEAHFREIFVRHCLQRMGIAPEVRFVIDGKLFREGRARSLAAEQDIMADASRPKAQKMPRINPEYRLELFVTGPCNQLSAACAEQLIQGRAEEFKPLFIHSYSGLGKTHQLQAIWWGIRESGRDCRAEYASAEEFTNQFIYAMRRNRLDAFRAKYRCVDVLLIDDIQFFADKPGLQEEFLHTFDALSGSDKQVVLASDVHPKRLDRVKESLICRFASGMVVALARPDFDTRVKILSHKVERAGVNVPDAVLAFLAERYQGSVRELCGALMTVVAYSNIIDRRPTLALAHEALAEVFRHGQALDMDRIEQAVAERFSVSQQDLHSGRRIRRIALPRQVCMYLARELTQLSCKEIARHFGGKNHTTVVFAHKRVAELCGKDSGLAEVVGELKTAMGGGKENG